MPQEGQQEQAVTLLRVRTAAREGCTDEIVTYAMLTILRHCRERDPGTNDHGVTTFQEK
jgi:hypothetical protein